VLQHAALVKLRRILCPQARKSMAERFENMLDQCLEGLRQGESLEQCLARYPEQAAELAPLLRVAMASQKASSAVKPRPECKARARSEIRSQLRAGSGSPNRRRRASLVDARWAVAVRQ